MGGKRRGPTCPRAHVFPFKRSHSNFLSMCVCVRLSAHKHTYLSTRKQTHKGNERERCRVQLGSGGGKASKQIHMLPWFCSGSGGGGRVEALRAGGVKEWKLETGAE